MGGVAGWVEAVNDAANYEPDVVLLLLLFGLG